MRVILTRVAVLSLLVIVAATGQGVLAQEAEGGEPAAATQDAVVVDMVQDQFTPDVIVIPAGTTVTWTNSEEDPNNSHNVISLADGIESPLIYPGESWSYTFVTPGTINYFCDLHEGMLGQVIVE
jgi:plastocyanin